MKSLTPTTEELAWDTVARLQGLQVGEQVEHLEHPGRYGRVETFEAGYAYVRWDVAHPTHQWVLRGGWTHLCDLVRVQVAACPA